MLCSLSHLYGRHLGALDAEIGHVKDFYFDEQSWVVRYVVADTGSWTPGSQVLISPHAFGGLHQVGRLLLVNLTRKQIEASPPMESHKLVSRPYEEDYFRYYGWPCYWQGNRRWGTTDLPVKKQLSNPPSGEAAVGSSETQRADSRLRSTRAVEGYHLQASDGVIGHVCDFLVDAQSWAIVRLVIKIGHRLSGREVQILTSHIDRIAHEQSTVFVNLTGKSVEQSPEHDRTQAVLQLEAGPSASTMTQPMPASDTAAIVT